MASLKGSPRDMNRWREVLVDPNIQFPCESGEYRRARKRLLEAEEELRRVNEKVAAERRPVAARLRTSLPSRSFASIPAATHGRPPDLPNA